MTTTTTKKPKITVPEFSSYGNKQGKSFVFSAGGIDVYFSYFTPVAFRTPTTGLVVVVNSWGPTTGRHLAAIDGGSKDAKGARVSGEAFEAMMIAAGIAV